MCLSWFPMYMTRKTIQQPFWSGQRVHFHLTKTTTKGWTPTQPFCRVSPSGLLFLTFMGQCWQHLVLVGNPQIFQELELVH
jgi:hypothetical protein